MTEIFFYHLLFQPLERALPTLLEKSLERGWRAAVQCASVARMKTLDDALWTYAPESFLPHATADESRAERQPVILTIHGDNPNNAEVRFFVERSVMLPVLESQATPFYRRALLLFDGRDEDDVAQAREQWRALKGRNYPVTYWQQEENQRWRKQA